jgi:hypothetical protein
MKTLPFALATLVLALVANAATPTPPPTAKSSPTAQPSVPAKPGPANLIGPGLILAPTSTPAGSPTPLATPMESPEKAITQAAPTPANNNPPPKPILYLTGMEAYTAGGKNWIRLRYDVLNKADYPADMFAAAPSLPPCGLNTNASRTWVDFFDAAGHRLYGFCALSKPADLGKIWFAYEEGTIPPSYVYIELNDRQTNTKYKSNLADTTL